MLIIDNGLSDNLTPEEKMAIDAYSRGAKIYDQGVRSIVEPVFNAFKGMGVIEVLRNLSPLNQSQRILDIGCGPGTLVPILGNLGMEYAGIDPAENMLTLAKNKYPEKVFHRLDVESLPIAFQPETFRAFVSSSSLMFMPPQRMTSALRKLRVVVVNNGIGIFTLPHPNKDGGYRIDIGEDEFIHATAYLWTVKQLEPHLKSSGFTVAEDFSSTNITALIVVTK